MYSHGHGISSVVVIQLTLAVKPPKARFPFSPAATLTDAPPGILMYN
jgi:hypothetical protein